MESREGSNCAGRKRAPERREWEKSWGKLSDSQVSLTDEAEQVCIVIDSRAGVHHGMSAKVGKQGMGRGEGRGGEGIKLRRSTSTQTNGNVSRARCDDGRHQEQESNHHAGQSSLVIKNLA